MRRARRQHVRVPVEFLRLVRSSIATASHLYVRRECSARVLFAWNSCFLFHLLLRRSIIDYLSTLATYLACLDISFASVNELIGLPVLFAVGGGGELSR